MGQILKGHEKAAQDFLKISPKSQGETLKSFKLRSDQILFALQKSHSGE